MVNVGPPQTVNLPAPAILTGSAYDDGLPSNSLTVTWSLQSGPGTATFDNANKAATAATFSIAGKYVMQLTASDGALSSSSTVTITVEASANWYAGWLASPLDQSTVTGQVPVTLIPGITLTSGTLTYFPAGHPEQSVTINASTTSSGQIGIFDTRCSTTALTLCC